MLPRSLNRDLKAYVRFINKTDKVVELIWLNYTGEYVRYQILKKGDYVDVNTYKTHPWIAVDTNTKDRMHIETSYIYQPQTTEEYLHQRWPNKQIPDDFEARISACITLPMYSLKYRSLLEIRNFLSYPESVDQLELPKPLADELKRTITHRNSQIQQNIQVREV